MFGNSLNSYAVGGSLIVLLVAALLLLSSFFDRKNKGPYVVFVGPPFRMNDDPEDLWDIVLKDGDGNPLEFETVDDACSEGRAELDQRGAPETFYWGTMTTGGKITGSAVSVNLS